MAKGQNTLAIGISLVKAAPAIVEFFRLFRGDHTGADTKAAAVNAGKIILMGAGQAALANNPKFEAQYGDVIQAAYDTAAAASEPSSIDPASIAIPGTPAAHA
jgi:hypothetical protein